MVSEEVRYKYSPKLSIRILAFLRQRRYEEKPVNTDDLKAHFGKSQVIISQNVPKLLNANLISSKFTGNPHSSGPRYEYEITRDGLMIINNLLNELLTESEQKLISKMNTQFEVGDYLAKLW